MSNLEWPLHTRWVRYQSMGLWWYEKETRKDLLYFPDVDTPREEEGSSNFGHLFLFFTGVLLVDSRDYGVWLMHSLPQFPYKKNRNTFWPPTGADNAQTFICVTVPYNQFEYVGKVPHSKKYKRYARRRKSAQIVTHVFVLPTPPPRSASTVHQGLPVWPWSSHQLQHRTKGRC